MTRSRLRRPMSKSITTTAWPVRASAAPKAAVDVVLPTPPFPDVTTTTLPISVTPCFSRVPPPVSSRRSHLPWLGREARHRHGSNRRRRSRRPKPRNRLRSRRRLGKLRFDLSGLDRRAAARLLAAWAPPFRRLHCQELEDRGPRCHRPCGRP